MQRRGKKSDLERGAELINQTKPEWTQMLELSATTLKELLEL